MAKTASTTAEKSGSHATENLAADIEQLKADIAEIAKQLQKVGQHSYGAARRAASKSVEQLGRPQTGNAGMQVTDTVRKKPVTSLAIAAGLGFLFALMTRR